MTKRFKFDCKGEEYEVVGAFGEGRTFTVTQLLPDARRMMRSAGSPEAKSGLKVLAASSNLSSLADLQAWLATAFPGMTGLREY